MRAISPPATLLTSGRLAVKKHRFGGTTGHETVYREGSEVRVARRRLQERCGTS
jgi:hypothetical protein